MSGRPFAQVDVFSAESCRGNPLAVVLDGTGLDEATMQRFARWTSSRQPSSRRRPTPARDYALRIFTPAANCRSPATRPSAAATPGSGVRRPAARRTRSCSNCAVGLVRIPPARAGRSPRRR